MTDRSGRDAIVALVSAIVLGSVATASLVEQRLAHGSRLGLWLGVATMLCVVQLFATLRPLAGTTRMWTTIHVAHVAGATVGILSVHALVYVLLLRRDPELVECLAQLVNDAVLVGCVLAFVWAVATRTLRGRLAWFALALVSCAAYLCTARRWHCDHIPGHPVQDYVQSQLTAAFDAAVALAAYLRSGRA